MIIHRTEPDIETITGELYIYYYSPTGSLPCTCFIYGRVRDKDYLIKYQVTSKGDKLVYSTKYAHNDVLAPSYKKLLVKSLSSDRAGGNHRSHCLKVRVNGILYNSLNEVKRAYDLSMGYTWNCYNKLISSGKSKIWCFHKLDLLWELPD